MNNIIGFECSCCGEFHDQLPMSHGSPAPYYWYEIDPGDLMSAVSSLLIIVSLMINRRLNKIFVGYI